MKEIESKYKCIPFWSWNDTLDEGELVKQVEWMHENGVGGFFMHARGGLKTEYLGDKWFDCIRACSERARELGMEAYAYDENGWPSGFVGGRLLEDIENHDRYLTFEFGKYDEGALVSYDISTDTLKRVSSDCEECLNVYEHYSTSTADILNPEVVDKFIELTHEQYRIRDTYSLKGFFTDEPQYHRWGVPYTKVLAPYFKREYNEDILDGLGLLFVEKEGYRAFRYKFWRAMQSLMLESFAKRVYDWCDKYGYKLTGHYIEEDSLSGQMLCCAGIMPFYEYEHIPGIDYLGTYITDELAARQVSSVCAQLGKEQIITETYGCCGWDVTPKELKRIAEGQYVGGVNLMCQHLLPYTEHGQRKRDYPAHYSKINPWVRKKFKEFNDYFSILGKTLAQSEEIVSVGVLHPIRSAYFDYKRFQGENNNGLKPLEDAFSALIKRLCSRGVPHHYLDETILSRHARVEGRALIVGKCKYEYIILPKIYTMDKSTEALLREFVGNGGKVLLTDERPQYLEGESFDYDYLKSNLSWKEIIDAQPFKMSRNKSVRCAYRKDKDGRDFIYAVNLGEGEEVVRLEPSKGKSFLSYDILKDKYTKIGTEVHFDAGQSYLLYVSSEEPEVSSKKLAPLHLGKEFEVCEEVENYLTLDLISYSFDGKSYERPMHHMAVWSELLEKRYKGKLYLKYEFYLESVPSRCTLLAEDTNTLCVRVNGKELKRKGSAEIERTFYEYDVLSELVLGKNEAVIEIDYYQSEQVYYALFGENVTESLKNCLAYDTDIEPIYLRGNFGVYGELKRGKNNNIVLGEGFRIGRQRKKIKSLIRDGFPFFAGDIKLKQQIEVESPKAELVIDKRFQLVEVKVNGKDAGVMMFESHLDISKYLKKGKNEIEITLTVSNRNLLGPFHTRDQESPWISPESFERFGSWKNGESPYFCKPYAFVKTII